jgi:hypothetical protein
MAKSREGDNREKGGEVPISIQRLSESNYASKQPRHSRGL